MTIRKTEATVEIEANGPDAAEMVSQIVRTLVSNGYMGGQLYDVSRTEDGRIAAMGFRHEYETGEDFPEVPTEPAAATDKPDNVVEMKPKTEPEKDDCNCPACQIRRAISGVDVASPGSDRTVFFLFNPNGILPM